MNDDYGRYEWLAYGSGEALCDHDERLNPRKLHGTRASKRIKAHIYPYSDGTWRGRLASESPFNLNNTITCGSLDEARASLLALYLLTK